MESILIYCKTYKNDLNRVKRLLSSISTYNRDEIPVYLSFPLADLTYFQTLIDEHHCHYVFDEDIVNANPKTTHVELNQIRGGLSQQVIKSEFWRLIPCNAYLCIDSDSQFIRDFYKSDFLHTDGTPYTIIHQSKSFLQQATNLNKDYVQQAFLNESLLLKEKFGRVGLDYDFGPSPYLWSPKVWDSLDKEFLTPQQITLWDLVEKYPPENRWYGEALLKTKAIPLYPTENLFKVYHYEWEEKQAKKMGETIEKLQKNYLGVIFQSNWDRSLDNSFSKKPLPSRLWRKIKNSLKNR